MADLHNNLRIFEYLRDQARAFAGLPPEKGETTFEMFTAPVPNSTAPKPSPFGNCSRWLLQRGT
jgi:hypothetical protein